MMGMGHKKGMCLVMMVVCMLTAQATRAVVLKVEVTGVVDTVQWGNGLELDGSVIEGTMMSGWVVYDSEAADQMPQFASDGIYEVIATEMSLGDYVFFNDPLVSDALWFYTSSAANFHHYVVAEVPSFDGVFYIDGQPKSSGDLTLDMFKLAPLYLVGWNDYGFGDELPTSFLDLGFYTDKSFHIGSAPDHVGPGFRIDGTLTSIRVIPEPGTVALLSLGGLVAFRRRRSR